uniref:Pco093185f n=1 Tax=Arundo donax TaxID=35708 RepID=A0A0A9EWS8_ARUDO
MPFMLTLRLCPLCACLDLDAVIRSCFARFPFIRQVL